ncbi:LOW QUALITY PROTEIN: hypothetical protein ElyMa_001210700 [Elysia marginata]|uniref:Uncharacterized protein n=1 Tax=Elysia marginata TaxID=1093978 RepID=A0AAV4I7J3_9GAST|nr:LOW QUALITY PROTEIN: hypothetical protein ElyMa_001210700 [Elysia marginata]
MYSVCTVAASPKLLQQLPQGCQSSHAAPADKCRSDPSPAMPGVPQKDGLPGGSKAERAPHGRTTSKTSSDDDHQRRVSNPEPQLRRTPDGIQCVCSKCRRRNRQPESGAACRSGGDIGLMKLQQSRSSRLRRYSLPVQHPPPAQPNRVRSNQNRVTWPASLATESQPIASGDSSPNKASHNKPEKDVPEASSYCPGSRGPGSQVYRREHSYPVYDAQSHRISRIADGRDADLTASIIASCDRNRPPGGYSSMARTERDVLVRPMEGIENARVAPNSREGSNSHSRSSTRRRRSSQTSGRSGGHSQAGSERDLTQSRRVSDNTSSAARGRADHAGGGGGYMHITNRHVSINYDNSTATATSVLTTTTPQQPAWLPPSAPPGEAEVQPVRLTGMLGETRVQVCGTRPNTRSGAGTACSPSLVSS